MNDDLSSIASVILTSYDRALCDIMYRESQNRTPAVPTSAREIAVNVGMRLIDARTTRGNVALTSSLRNTPCPPR